MRWTSCIAVVTLSAATLSGACAADEPGSHDHPLIGRYEGSSIVSYKRADFDEAALLKAPHDAEAQLARSAPHDRSGSEWIKLEGRVSRIRYEIPAGRSSLEVMRNFEASLKAKSAETLFSCVDQTCFTGSLRDPYLLGTEIDDGNPVSTTYFDKARYLLAKLPRPDGETHVALLVGEGNGQTTAFVIAVDSKPMETDKIGFVDADRMAEAIRSTGRVVLYGILFDFDRDTIRPESQPTLDEIGKVLAGRPDLKIEVVGHTDDKGTAAYNLDLSRRRAARVVSALVSGHGVAARRLSSSGAGMTSPIAPNDTDANRARNRRVELVAK